MNQPISILVIPIFLGKIHIGITFNALEQNLINHKQNTHTQCVKLHFKIKQVKIINQKVIVKLFNTNSHIQMFLERQNVFIKVLIKKYSP